MKNILKFAVASLLALLARAVVHRYKPRIVMVTGSVGKTSTKDAVAVVLSSKYFVRKSEKSFNSEFGVPFTILGVDNPWNNPLAWFSLVKHSIGLLMLPNHYPEVLVLEVGADKPGDLSRILRMATPDAVVVTKLPEVPVHVEAYASPSAVREEEFSPVYALAESAPLIISADDRYALESAVRTQAHVFSFGIAHGATVQLSNIDFAESDNRVEGMRSDVSVNGEKGDLVVKGSVGVTQVLPAAAALAVAVAYNISAVDAITALEGYEPPAGRGRLLAGKNDSIIIDDSYNSSPVAAEQALATLKVFPNAARRIAVLGDMLELGRYSVTEHERIATIARISVDLVVAVGVRSRVIALVQGSAEVQLFDNARAAAEWLVKNVRSGDVVLIKGSQSIRTERIVKLLLANAKDSSRLVRQESKWKAKD